MGNVEHNQHSYYQRPNYMVTHMPHCCVLLLSLLRKILNVFVFRRIVLTEIWLVI
jgi:hypothetical protein